MPNATPALPPSFLFSPKEDSAEEADHLLRTLLDVSLTGVILFRPVYGTGADAATVVDFAYEYLNPAAQRMLRQPERPAQTYLTLYPHAVEAGIFAFYRDSYLRDSTERLDVNYQHDGLDNFFQITARRSDNRLVVSFSDTADHSRSAAEQSLRESQVRERAALAEAEAQRLRLYEVVMQLPAKVVVHHGPEHVFQYVNPRYQKLFNNRPLLGRTLREALPEMEALYFERFDEVYRTGEPFYATEMEAALDFSNTGVVEPRFFNLFFQALRDANGAINGILNFAYDVTEQVVARKQVHQLNLDLAETNEEIQRAFQHVEKAQAEVENQRQRLHNMFMQAPAMICIFEGPDHIFQLVNPPYQALVGDRPLVGRPIMEAMPELTGQPILGLLDKVYQTGESFFAHEMLVQLDHQNEGGGTLGQNYYNFTYQAYRNLEDEVEGILVFAYEVTAQVVARQQVEVLNEVLVANNTELLATQEELQDLNTELEARVGARTEALALAQADTERQRNQLHRLFLEAPAAICILSGPDLVFELVNPTYQQLFPGRELHGRRLLDALPELRGQRVHQTFQQVYTTGITHEEHAIKVDLTRETDGGLESRYFNYIQQARFNEHHEIDGILVFAFEVTEQVQAREASERDAQRLRLITDGLPALISYIDYSERYQFTNEGYKYWFNQHPDELLGKTVMDVVGPKAYANVKRYIDRALAGERIDFEAMMPYRDDLVRHIRTNYVPDIESGKVVGFFAMVSDITEEVMARQEVQALNEELAAINEELNVTNEELRETNERLSRTNADLDNFVYTASHDLRAPITNLEGLLHALREELPDALRRAAPVKPLLEMMQGAVDRFQLTISQLTEISKLQQAPDQTIAKNDLATVIEDVRLDLAYMLKAGNVQMTVDVTACPTVTFSPKNLRSIIYNLLSNAVKYRAFDRQPVVHLRCHCTSHYTVLEVEDNGLGLTDLQQSKLFTMFQRLHSHVEGSGVGLYMVKKIVDNAGGTIRVLSLPGIGSTFIVTLPDSAG